MHNFLLSIVNSGVNTERDFSINDWHIRMANYICLVLIIFNLGVSSILYHYNGWETSSSLSLFTLLIFISTILINKIGYVNVSRYFLCYAVPVYILFVSVVDKIYTTTPIYKMEYYDVRILILVNCITPLIVFPFSNKVALIIGLLGSAIPLLLYDNIHEWVGFGYLTTVNDPEPGYSIFNFYFAIAYSMIVMGMLFFKSVYERMNTKNTVLLEKVDAKNRELYKTNVALNKSNFEIEEYTKEIVIQRDNLKHSKISLENKQLVIAEQKSELEFKNNKLLQLVEERTNDLKKSNDELIKHNSELEQFSNTISHNLKGPVASLLGLTKVLSLSDDKDIENNRQALEHIKSSAHALNDVLTDLSKVVDIRNHLYRIKENVNLKEEIDLVIHTMLEQVKQPEVSLLTNFEIKNVYAIKSYINSIIYNLVSNALKYKSKDRNLEVKISSKYEGNYVLLEIADNGIGIDLEKFGNQIFKMYKRFNDFTEGRGLGLYLIKQQVETMGGQISVESKLNEGSKFTILIPNKIEWGRQVYYDNEFASLALDLEKDTTYFKWKKTPDFNNYKKIFKDNAAAFKTYATKFWLADVTMGTNISPDSRLWLMRNVLSTADKFGVIKVAIKVEKENLGDPTWVKVEEFIEPLGVELRLFSLESDATKWLIENKSE